MLIKHGSITSFVTTACNTVFFNTFLSVQIPCGKCTIVYYNISCQKVKPKLQETKVLKYA